MGQLWLHSLVIFIVLFLRNIQAQRTGNAFFTSFPFFCRPRPGSSVFDHFTISLTVRGTEEGRARVHGVEPRQRFWLWLCPQASAQVEMAADFIVRGSLVFASKVFQAVKLSSFDTYLNASAFWKAFPWLGFLTKIYIHFVDVIDKCKPYVAGLARLNFSDGKIKLMVNFIMMNFLHV